MKTDNELIAEFIELEVNSYKEKLKAWIKERKQFFEDNTQEMYRDDSYEAVMFELNEFDELIDKL